MDRRNALDDVWHDLTVARRRLRHWKARLRALNEAAAKRTTLRKAAPAFNARNPPLGMDRADIAESDDFVRVTSKIREAQQRIRSLEVKIDAGGGGALSTEDDPMSMQNSDTDTIDFIPQTEIAVPRIGEHIATQLKEGGKFGGGRIYVVQQRLGDGLSGVVFSVKKMKCIQANAKAKVENNIHSSSGEKRLPELDQVAIKIGLKSELQIEIDQLKALTDARLSTHYIVSYSCNVVLPCEFGEGNKNPALGMLVMPLGVSYQRYVHELGAKPMKGMTDRDFKGALLNAFRPLREIATAVAYLISKGFVHGDIKPGNIVLIGDQNKATNRVEFIRPVLIDLASVSQVNTPCQVQGGTEGWMGMGMHVRRRAMQIHSAEVTASRAKFDPVDWEEVIRWRALVTETAQAPHYEDDAFALAYTLLWAIATLDGDARSMQELHIKPATLDTLMETLQQGDWHGYRRHSEALDDWYIAHWRKPREEGLVKYGAEAIPSEFLYRLLLKARHPGLEILFPFLKACFMQSLQDKFLSAEPVPLHAKLGDLTLEAAALQSLLEIEYAKSPAYVMADPSLLPDDDGQDEDALMEL